jgi:hypothetical protein
VPRWVMFTTNEVETLDAVLSDEENLTEMVVDGAAEHEDVSVEDYATEVGHQVEHQQIVKVIRQKLSEADDATA